MDTYPALALLTDIELRRFLASICEAEGLDDIAIGALIEEPHGEAIFITSEGLSYNLTEELDSHEKQAKALRRLAVEFAEQESFSDRLQKWLRDPRGRLFDPFTISIILAGIVLVLKTKYAVSVSYSKQDGLKFDAAAEVDKTPNKMINKIIGIGNPTAGQS